MTNSKHLCPRLLAAVPSATLRADLTGRACHALLESRLKPARLRHSFGVTHLPSSKARIQIQGFRHQLWLLRGHFRPLQIQHLQDRAWTPALLLYQSWVGLKLSHWPGHPSDTLHCGWLYHQTLCRGDSEEYLPSQRDNDTTGVTAVTDGTQRSTQPRDGFWSRKVLSFFKQIPSPTTEPGPVPRSGE